MPRYRPMPKIRRPVLRRPQRLRRSSKRPTVDGMLVVLALIVGLAVVAQATVPAAIEQGPRGRNGADGPAGAPGFAALVDTSPESPGGNCANGGVEVNSGIDDGAMGGTAYDFTLQGGEIRQTIHVCDGAGGSGSGANGNDSLVVTSIEPPGVNCALGGVQADVGVDNGDGGGTQQDGILQAGEIDYTSYVCEQQGPAGVPGDDGFLSLIALTAEGAGANCANGGTKFEAGIDNGDGGGTAGDAILQAGEKDVTQYVCAGSNGAAGADGDDGFNSLITSAAEAPGGNCANGGLKISSGSDNGDGGGTARDGILQSGEVDNIGYACQTDPGFNSLVKTSVESPGGNCANGGIKIESGLDNGDGGGTARDGTLQAGEVDGAAAYTCHGNGLIVDALTGAFTSTSTTGAKVTNLDQALATGSTYLFHYTLICQTAAVGTGIDFGISFSGTQSVILAQMYYQDTGSSASTGVADGTVTGDAAELIIAGGSTITETTTTPNLNAITGVGGANENFLVVIEGLVITTSTGNLELYSATDVASSQITIGIGSSLVITKTG